MLSIHSSRWYAYKQSIKKDKQKLFLPLFFVYVSQKKKKTIEKENDFNKLHYFPCEGARPTISLGPSPTKGCLSENERI